LVLGNYMSGIVNTGSIDLLQLTEFVIAEVDLGGDYSGASLADVFELMVVFIGIDRTS
jgi:hypothetical protein